VNSDYLIDTQTFLWAAITPAKIERAVRTILQDASLSISVSVISFWEISLKFGLGKLELENVSPAELPEVAREMRFSIESLDPLDAAQYFKLPRRAHKDPFDRMLVWQCIRRNCTLISTDVALHEYESDGLRLLLY
jgi:PIN domain nuclease of toxin-antitoxin system